MPSPKFLNNVGRVAWRSSVLVAAGTIMLARASLAQDAVSGVESVPDFGWLSILPPLVAILLALLFRRVIPALFAGVWIGAWALKGWSGFLTSFFDTFQVFVLGALADSDHAAIILFTFMIGGMVGIIAKNGGMQGVVNLLVGWATTPKKGQLTTSFLGLAVFFDDYANTLVVGNTMRPVTDRLLVSREKLAYIVDSTAAPVACIAFATTWVGYEVGLIGDSISTIPGIEASPYGIFLSSIAYSFYPVLAIFFVLLIASSGKDFGAMYKAETRARSKRGVFRQGAKVDDLEAAEAGPKEGVPQRAVNAILPVLVLVFGVLVGLFITGEGDSIKDIIGSSDSYKSLMWASLAGAMTAGVLSVGQRILSLEETVEAWYNGLKAMLFAMIILVLAWSLSAVTEELGTANFLTDRLGDALNPGLLPAIVFLLAAATAFATGSSWGAMGILMPLVIPLAWAVMVKNGMADASGYHILYSSVSCILAGSVWGDHCSPISDTTILSSMASGCDHVDHVRTQLPYALLVGGTAVLFGTIPAGFGMPWWIGMIVSAVILFGVLAFVGKPVDIAGSE